jgi:hypothetical protein
LRSRRSQYVPDPAREPVIGNCCQERRYRPDLGAVRDVPLKIVVKLLTSEIGSRGTTCRMEHAWSLDQSMSPYPASDPYMATARRLPLKRALIDPGFKFRHALLGGVGS